MRQAAEAGARVLLVEDEFFVALAVEDVLQGLGCTIVGPVPNLTGALQAALTEALSGAVLDVNLNGEKVFPAADELLARRIPFVFATGYGSADLPERFRNIPRVQKPFSPDDLRQTVRECLLA